MLYAPWVQLSLASTNLWWESARVIGLRMLLLSQGGAKAQAEAARLVPEKLAALIDTQTEIAFDVMRGRSDLAPQRAIAAYRRRVRSNYRRLKS